MATVFTGREAAGEGRVSTGALRYLPGVALSGSAVLLLTAAWLLRTSTSAYWLDETGTYWATNAGLKEIPARCAVFPLSMLYAWLILVLRSLFGSGEAVLRIPSLVSIALATYILFRDVRARWGSNAAWITAVIFVSVPEVLFLAGDARPYAPGLLFATLSTTLLLRFFARPGYASAALYALTAALMVHMQILFGLVVAAHLLFAGLQWRRGGSPMVRYLAAALVLLIAFAGPAVALRMLSIGGHPEAHSYAGPPGVLNLAEAFFPIPVMAAILGAAAAVMVLAADIGIPHAGYSDELILAGLVALIPPLLCFVAARALHLGLFLGRYYVGYAVGLAVCCGALLGPLRSGRAAKLAMICIALFQVASLGSLIANAQGHTMHRGDWAAAVAFVDQNTAADGAPVLIRSQYVESDFNPVEPVSGNPMFSQLVRYPSRSRMTGLRATLNEADVEQALNSIRNSGAFQGRLLLMSYDGPKSLDILLTFLAGRLGPAFTLREIGDFDGIHVLEFRQNR